MARNPTSPFITDATRFEELVTRYARFRTWRIKAVVDRELPSRILNHEETLIDCWETDFIEEYDSITVIENIGILYKAGASVLQILEATAAFAQKLPKADGRPRTYLYGERNTEPRKAFRCLIKLFAFQKAMHQRLHPTAKDVSLKTIILESKPSRLLLGRKKADKFAEDYNKGEGILENTPKEPQQATLMNWLGTQAELGELFVELKRGGWIDAISLSALQAAFAPTGNMVKTLLPYPDKDGEPQYKNIYKTRYKPKFHRITRNSKAKRL